MVTANQLLIKFLLSLNLSFSRPQMDYLVRFVQGILLSPGKRTVSNIHRASWKERDASCYIRFLNESPWNEVCLQKKRQRFLRERLFLKPSEQPSTGFLILDDTSNRKNVQSRHIEGLNFHYSHTEQKSVWGHCLVTSHLVSRDYSLPWDFRLYLRKEDCEQRQRTFQSKVNLAVDLVRSYSPVDDKTYVMADSWYTSEALIQACDEKGFFYIGAIKTNRILYPWGHRASIQQLASCLRPQDLHTVTVKEKRYDLFTYEGKVGKLDNAKVVLCWEGGYRTGQAPFCLLCTDVSLDSETILAYYGQRWNIETGYRTLKESLGFDHYQIRSLKAIQRFWTLQFLSYTYLELRRREEGFQTVGEVLLREREENLGRIVLHAYNQGMRQIPLERVLRELHLTA